MKNLVASSLSYGITSVYPQPYSVYSLIICQLYSIPKLFLFILKNKYSFHILYSIKNRKQQWFSKMMNADQILSAIITSSVFSPLAMTLNGLKFAFWCRK